MKRLHVHVRVADLAASIDFYSTLFGAEPSIRREDYAKWRLGEPAINFAISAGSATPGIDHLGIEVDSDEELQDLAARGDVAGIDREAEAGARCCYARSNKNWFTDPQGVRWETFHTLGPADALRNIPAAGEHRDARCCA